MREVCEVPRKCRMGIVLSALGVGGVVLLSFSTIAGRATSVSLSLSLCRSFVCLDGYPSVRLYVRMCVAHCSAFLVSVAEDAIMGGREASKEGENCRQAASCPLTHSLCVCKAR